MPVLAQFVVANSLIQWVIVAIVVASVIGIALVVVRQSGIPIPGWLVQVLWIVLLAVVAIAAIRFLASSL
jgi:hypothetical protein